MNYYNRNLEETIKKMLSWFPAVAITGPRQSGKSTLSTHLFENMDNVVYLDLERLEDLKLLDDTERFFDSNEGKSFCIDEIQRKPELFPHLRYLIDKYQRNGVFLFLGSASRDMLRQSSETLAGRICYKQLTPFLWSELPSEITIYDYFLKGGFPLSIFKEMEISKEWRNSFITTFLERDLLQWANFTPTLMGRLWSMLAHNNGQTVNYSQLSKSLLISDKTIKSYIDLLEATFMVYAVQPYHSNLGKRIIKAPKIYIADSGITCSLLNINSSLTLLNNPVYGSLWEQLVLLNLTGHFADAKFYFYRTAIGSEVDFVMKYEGKTFAIECKAGDSFSLSKGNYNAIEDINPDMTYVVALVDRGYSKSDKIEIVTLAELIEKIEKYTK